MERELQKIGNTTMCPVAVIIRDNKVLLGYRHYTPDKWKSVSVWTCPGGRCDEGETVETTLRREVKEETGIDQVKIIDFISEVQGAKDGDVVPLFLCSTKQKPALTEPHKFSQWRWFSLNNFPDEFINDKIRLIILKLLKN